MYIILILIIVNAAGYLLKYFSLDRFIIVLGFRFHLSLVLPFLLLLASQKYVLMKSELKRFRDGKYLSHFILSIFSLCIPAIGLYLGDLLTTADPDYFYEFGVSSIIDLPIYFFWNLPQLLMVALFLKTSSGTSKMKYIICFVLTVFLFAYEVAPLPNEKLSLISTYSLVAMGLLSTLILLNAKNVYSFVLVLFISLWGNILLYGSNNATFVKILFAKNYEKWDGFFEVSKGLANYSLVIQTIITLIFFSIYYIVTHKKEENV